MTTLRYIFLPNRPGQKWLRRTKSNPNLKHPRQWYAFKVPSKPQTPEEIKAGLLKLL